MQELEISSYLYKMDPPGNIRIKYCQEGFSYGETMGEEYKGGIYHIIVQILDKKLQKRMHLQILDSYLAFEVHFIYGLL